MNIRTARFCVNCEEIFEERLTCPRCGGLGWWLQKWLNRPEDAGDKGTRITESGQNHDGQNSRAMLGDL